MKKIVMFIGLMILLIGCSKNNRLEPEVIIEHKTIQESDQGFDLNDYVGIFKYEYDHNTEDLIEDHTIILEVKEGVLSGRYYGTSDTFESTREGYYPGFFVLNMEELLIEGDRISYKLVLSGNELFTKPVELIYASSSEVPITVNPLWNQTHLSSGSIAHSGEITKDRITIDTTFGPLEFLRVD